MLKRRSTLCNANLAVMRMATVTLSYDELVDQDVPDTCIRCGQPADLAVWQKFTRHGFLKRWIYLPIPVCDRHRSGIPFIGSVRASRLGGGAITLKNVAQGFAEDLTERRASRRPASSRLGLPPKPVDWERQYYRTLRIIVFSLAGVVSLCFVGGIILRAVLVSLPKHNPPSSAPPEVRKPPDMEFPVALRKKALAINVVSSSSFPAGVPWAGRALACSVNDAAHPPVRQALTALPAPAGMPFPGGVPWTAAALAQGPWPWLPDAVVDELLAELRSDGGGRAKAAAERLAEAAANARQIEVARALEPLLASKQTQEAAVWALARWGDKDSVPGLIRLLEEPFAARDLVMDALVALKDPRAIQPIARRVSDGWDRGKALKSLRAFGSAAEPAVLELLADKNIFLQQEACNMLRDIGTPASLDALQKLAADNRQPILQQAARAAIQAIGKRQHGD
jgi:hypothetical protein